MTRAKANHAAAAAAECPDGNDDPAVPTRWATSGRSRSTIHFSPLLIEHDPDERRPEEQRHVGVAVAARSRATATTTHDDHQVGGAAEVGEPVEDGSSTTTWRCRLPHSATRLVPRAPARCRGRPCRTRRRRRARSRTTMARATTSISPPTTLPVDRLRGDLAEAGVPPSQRTSQRSSASGSTGSGAPASADSAHDRDRRDDGGDERRRASPASHGSLGQSAPMSRWRGAETTQNTP